MLHREAEVIRSSPAAAASRPLRPSREADHAPCSAPSGSRRVKAGGQRRRGRARPPDCAGGSKAWRRDRAPSGIGWSRQGGLASRRMALQACLRQGCPGRAPGGPRTCFKAAPSACTPRMRRQGLCGSVCSSQGCRWCCEQQACARLHATPVHPWHPCGGADPSGGGTVPHSEPPAHLARHREGADPGALARCHGAVRGARVTAPRGRSVRLLGAAAARSRGAGGRGRRQPSGCHQTLLAVRIRRAPRRPYCLGEICRWALERGLCFSPLPTRSCIPRHDARVLRTLHRGGLLHSDGARRPHHLPGADQSLSVHDLGSMARIQHVLPGSPLHPHSRFPGELRLHPGPSRRPLQPRIWS
mmetsp:Transcript_107406/g.342217  ORF Transcript_107406/g.342217 Transcript_107406/m.342217 type:complete len:358 (-) Transcript_107406:815-1888(-)